MLWFPSWISQFCICSSLCCEEISMWQRYYPVYMPLDQAWRKLCCPSLNACCLMWRISLFSHVLSSLWCWLLLSSVCRSTICLKGHLLANLISLENHWQLFPWHSDTELSLTTPPSSVRLSQVATHRIFVSSKISLPSVFIQVRTSSWYTIHPTILDDRSQICISVSDEMSIGTNSIFFSPLWTNNLVILG